MQICGTQISLQDGLTVGVGLGGWVGASVGIGMGDEVSFGVGWEGIRLGVGDEGMGSVPMLCDGAAVGVEIGAGTTLPIGEAVNCVMLGEPVHDGDASASSGSAMTVSRVTSTKLPSPISSRVKSTSLIAHDW